MQTPAETPVLPLPPVRKQPLTGGVPGIEMSQLPETRNRLSQTCQHTETLNPKPLESQTLNPKPPESQTLNLSTPRSLQLEVIGGFCLGLRVDPLKEPLEIP